MAAPKIGHRRGRIPPDTARLNRQHPLAAGLVSLWWPGLQKDAVDGVPWYPTLVDPWTTGPHGLAAVGAADSARWSRDKDPMPTAHNNGGILTRQRIVNPLSGGGSAIGVGDVAAGSTNWGAFFPFFDGTIYFDIVTSANRVTYAGTYGTWQTWALTNGPTNGQSIWLDAKRVANGAQASGARSASNFYGLGSHSSTIALRAECSIIAAYGVEPSASQIAAFHIDPFAMLTW